MLSRGGGKELTISTVMSFPLLSRLTHNRSKVESFCRGGSSNVLNRMASKVGSRANMAKSRESR